ncbi:MAG TPA: hypothetical protein VF234_09365 [Limnochordia bacterium]
MRSGWLLFFTVGLTTLAISAALSLASRSLLSVLQLGPSFVLLLFIIGIGVACDIVGVAATAADEMAMHAMAADKVAGARQAVWLVRHADRVASFANDLMGDVAGTLSGAVAAIIVVRIGTAASSLGIPEALLSALVLGLTAGLTVGGKAVGKRLAIRRANTVVAFTGWMLWGVERLFGVSLGADGHAKKARAARRRR